MGTRKKILLIVGGGIAAYKSLDLIRRLKERDFEVRGVLTQAGEKFVTPLSVAALSGHQVVTDLFSHQSEAQFGHIELARWADTILVAPATADFMAKVAYGHADDLATAIILAGTGRVMFAPAMNVRMWENQATQSNLTRLKEFGYSFVGPDEGTMACGEYGPGRMAEPEQIAEALESAQPQATSGRGEGLTAVVTSGPTREAIDPIRYISNHSSGKQGSEIAKALAEQGFGVTLILGPCNVKVGKEINTIRVESAQDMLEVASKQLPTDVFVSAAAVGDWRVAEYSRSKHKKSGPEQTLSLEFVQNPDILQNVSGLTDNRPKLVIGFAAETSNLEDFARRKLANKGCDWIVANNVGEGSGVMGGDWNEVQLHSSDGTKSYPRMTKQDVAVMLVDQILTHFDR